MKIKWKLLTVGLLSATYLSFVFYINFFSKNAQRAKRNINNINKVKKDMSIQEVYSIMGTPDKSSTRILSKYDPTKEHCCFYSTNDGSHPYMTIVLDSTNKVKQVYR